MSRALLDAPAVARVVDRIAHQLLEQTGERARVAVNYTLAGQPVAAEVELERHDGRWYLTDLLRHAEVEAAGVPAVPPAGAAPGTSPAPERTNDTPEPALTVR